MKRGETTSQDSENTIIKTIVYDSYEFKPDFHRISRQEPETLSLDRRIGISEVEKCFSIAQGCSESTRCLRCQIYTVFDSDICILCGGCIDICPTSCLKIIESKQVENEMIEFSHFEEKNNDEASSTYQLIIKDDNLCIQCGQCYRRCPVHAITMESFEITREYNL